MNITSKGRYALRLMLDLAEHADEGYISLKDVSERQGITLKYLEQIVTPLAREGLVKSHRGKTGGYCLNRPPAEYRVGDILRALEGKLVPVSCLVNTPNRCERSNECATLFFWKGLSETINRYVDEYSLQDLQEEERSIRERKNLLKGNGV